MIKVLFISRSTLYSAPGGDSIQIGKTKEYLENSYDVKVDILTNEKPVDYSQYDLLHFFNLIRPGAILKHLSSGLPYVISPVYVDYSEYDQHVRGGVFGLLSKIFGKGRTEYLKSIARWIKNGEHPGSKEYLTLGFDHSIEKILDDCAVLLPNSESELERIKDDFNVACKSVIVPNAIDTRLFNYDPEQEKKGVLCVARIEGVKNQLNLIKAIKETDLILTIIGKAAPNHSSYFEECKEEANHQVLFIDHISQEKLIEHYKKAKVHAMVSWFETTGLSSLEAAACGCNPVISDKGDQREYFRDEVFYCNPNSVDSIRDALLLAHYSDVSETLIKRINKKYNWSLTAEKTMKAYRYAVSKKK
jgi:glycosyltransferase involved in cell wall biosynthesis